MNALGKTYAGGVAALCILTLACGQPPVVQQAPGTIPSSTFPNAGNPVPQAPAPIMTRAQANDAFRWAYAMDTANKAAQLGAILGGPYGGPAGMGMGVLGLLYGAVTASAKLAEEEARAQEEYRKEATKDEQLEAAIERELEQQTGFQDQLTADGKLELARQSAHMEQKSTRHGAGENDTLLASLNRRRVLPAPFKNVEIRDLNNDGIADLWIYYSPQSPGEILRQEESSKMDGRVDTWSYYKDGKLVRRDVDHHGYGRPDTVYYYDDQNIVREERDETGHGRVTYRADYRDGRLARVERETRGSGRLDLWITYDTARQGEIVLKEERDLNGDGFPDLLSHYEAGRLVRRDVNAVGLELLSKQDQTPPEISRLPAAPLTK